ncbi:MAG TPA: hypothetical protein VN903_35590 [Polyangia bacterium]|nr:hypothetical protein [Polyangia bacterium]
MLGKLKTISMTATGVYDWYNNGQNVVLVTHYVLKNFSDFPDGTATPATWAFSVGTDSPTSPVNMRAAGTISGAPGTPVVTAQSFSVSTLTPYVMPRTTVYFAVTTTTNGVGTFDAEIYGGYLNRTS